MKVFLTGATGFIGHHLFLALSQKGYRLTCSVLTKKEAKLLKTINKNCQTMVVDLTDKNLTAKLVPQLKNFDLVFHLAALNTEWGPSKKEFEKTNVIAVKNLLQAAWEAGVKHLILTSSAHLLGNPPKKIPASEKSAPAPASEYSRSKVRAEKLALAYFNKGLPVTIIRPTFVYGPNDKKGAISRFFDQIKKGRIIIAGNGKNRFQHVYVKDLVSAYLAAAQKKGKGEIYIIAGNETVSLNKLFTIMAKALKVQPPQVIKVSKWLALPLSYPLALAFTIGRKLSLPILKNEPFLNPQKVNFISGNFVFNIKKATQQLGFTPKYSIEKGLAEIISSSKNLSA